MELDDNIDFSVKSKLHLHIQVLINPRNTVLVKYNNIKHISSIDKRPQYLIIDQNKKQLAWGGGVSLSGL